jgi:hypothetical protein
MKILFFAGEFNSALLVVLHPLLQNLPDWTVWASVHQTKKQYKQKSSTKKKYTHFHNVLLGVCELEKNYFFGLLKHVTRKKV